MTSGFKKFMVVFFFLVCSQGSGENRQTTVVTEELGSTEEVAPGFQEHQGRTAWDAQSRKSWAEP